MQVKLEEKWPGEMEVEVEVEVGGDQGGTDMVALPDAFFKFWACASIETLRLEGLGK